MKIRTLEARILDYQTQTYKKTLNKETNETKTNNDQFNTRKTKHKLQEYSSRPFYNEPEPILLEIFYLKNSFQSHFTPSKQDQIRKIYSTKTMNAIIIYTIK